MHDAINIIAAKAIRLRGFMGGGNSLLATSIEQIFLQFNALHHILVPAACKGCVWLKNKIEWN